MFATASLASFSLGSEDVRSSAGWRGQPLGGSVAAVGNFSYY